MTPDGPTAADATSPPRRLVGRLRAAYAVVVGRVTLLAAAALQPLMALGPVGLAALADPLLLGPLLVAVAAVAVGVAVARLVRRLGDR